jgi:methyl-accepting chemotaxis protein
MLNNIKIGPKLIAGFLCVALIGAIIGVIGLNNINIIGKNKLPAVQALLEMGKEQNSLQYALRGTMLPRYWSNLKLISDQFTAYDEANKNILNCLERYQRLQKTKEESAEFDRLTRSATEWSKATDALYNNGKQKYKLVESGVAMNDPKIIALDNELYEVLAPAARTSYIETVASMGKLISLNNESATSAIKFSGFIMPAAIVVGVISAILLGLFLTFSITGPMSKIVSMIEKLAHGDKDTHEMQMNRKDELGTLADSMNKLFHAIKSLIEEDGGVVLQAAANKDLTKRMTRDYEGSFAMMKDNINKVIASLDEALTQVTEATEQVSSASQQISAGSQNLAQGANEQASSLEEVSSSLEEMASMTKQNAENANQAKNLAGEANNNASSGISAMKRMNTSIVKIKESSDQTAKIVKTIDEIAMQTNLLALNAAVEAARAGEAGRGFAVVAEEVRNLAQRSAEAAKNTANMIEESVKNAEEGVTISTEASKSFDIIEESVRKVNDLIAEIAAASQEQSQGIDQINTAVAQMDKVTQQNAANSEESASASEQLSSQAEELQSMIAQFILSQATQRRITSHSTTMKKTSFTAHPKPMKKTAATTDFAAAKQVSAEQLIPMDNEILKEF